MASEKESIFTEVTLEVGQKLTEMRKEFRKVGKVPFMKRRVPVKREVPNAADGI